MEKLKEEKEPSRLWIAFKWLLSMIFFGPSFKVLKLNHELKRMVEIDKSSPENAKKKPSVVVDENGKKIKQKGSFSMSPETSWLKKQIRLNYIVAIILALPLAYGIFKGTTYLDNDPYLSARLERVERENAKSGIIDNISNYYYVFAESPKDSYDLKMQKYETKVRITAFLIMLSLMLALHLLGSVIANHHPLIEDSKRVRELLVQTGLYRREDGENMLVFATPVGFLLDTSGNSPTEIERADRIWAALNIKIKGFQPDPKKRSIVFFKKAYELQSSYMYDKITDVVKK